MQFVTVGTEVLEACAKLVNDYRSWLTWEETCHLLVEELGNDYEPFRLAQGCLIDHRKRRMDGVSYPAIGWNEVQKAEWAIYHDWCRLVGEPVPFPEPPSPFDLSRVAYCGYLVLRQMAGNDDVKDAYIAWRIAFDDNNCHPSLGWDYGVAESYTSFLLGRDPRSDCQ